MANLLQSPSTALKLKNKEAVNKIKFGSPKVQQVLRQRCRERMREKRRELFNVRRIGLSNETDADENIHDTLTEIVRQEMSGLTTKTDDDNRHISTLFDEPLTVEEIFELERELLEEEEEWILQEYERLSNNEDYMLNLYVEETFKDTVVCPICEKSALVETQDGFICTACNLCLPPKMNLHQLSTVIGSQLNSHSAICHGQTSFITLPENNSLSLYLTCETCSCFSLIL